MMAHNDYARAMRGILATLPPQDADVSATVASWADALGVGSSRDWDESDNYLTSEMMDEMDIWDECVECGANLDNEDDSICPTCLKQYI